MYSPEIARQLRKRGHDVVAVRERGDLAGSSDQQLMSRMSLENRAIVTNNALDFLPLVAAATSAGEHHGGLFLTSDRSLPRRRDTIGRFVAVLDALLREGAPTQTRDQVRWLP